MAKRNATAKPEPDIQLLDAIAKANKRLETERERIFDAGALVEILSRGVRDPLDHSIIRTCDQIYAQLDAVAGALDVLRGELEQSAKCCQGDAEVAHG